MLLHIFLISILCFQGNGKYDPKIDILIHKDCKYSQALKTLLDWSGTEYGILDMDKNMDLVNQDKHIPKVFINGKLIGGYRDSLNMWQYVYRKLPLELDFSRLYNPEYVISKYSKSGESEIAK
ncbi:uncharacterized protein VICG_00910 [Vittaforma corneae ATCC 50505]|uniref:Glutaredoxin domain-containing protein n=1 Tax=Vittaforma corneae (strain ATCC 50505) TaxID=993615 RepID=L2GMJ7_VITCO|nr:uncharacterized protein VICG_00910 [Vittaforma corneae ATCC 50505]ELA42061.1 hypothetical protein VICG_00910 [Vittaforma corneae ATCC 50505]